MAEFSLPFVCVTGAGLLVVTQREPQIQLLHMLPTLWLMHLLKAVLDNQ